MALDWAAEIQPEATDFSRNEFPKLLDFNESLELLRFIADKGDYNINGQVYLNFSAQRDSYYICPARIAGTIWQKSKTFYVNTSYNLERELGPDGEGLFMALTLYSSETDYYEIDTDELELWKEVREHVQSYFNRQKH